MNATTLSTFERIGTGGLTNTILLYSKFQDGAQACADIAGMPAANFVGLILACELFRASLGPDAESVESAGTLNEGVILICCGASPVGTALEKVQSLLDQTTLSAVFNIYIFDSAEDFFRPYQQATFCGALNPTWRDVCDRARAFVQDFNARKAELGRIIQEAKTLPQKP